MSFELAHQKVQLQGRLAEAERKAAVIEEEAQKKVRVFTFLPNIGFVCCSIFAQRQYNNSLRCCSNSKHAVK